MFAAISAANGHSLDMETAFTTTAILSMITHPANMVMTFVPRIVAALSGFERIQAFLLREPLHAHGGTSPNVTFDKLAWNPASGQLVTPGRAIQMSQVQIGWMPAVLRDVNVDVAAGSFTVLSGPTGSGKSTLLRVILGEAVPAHGSVAVSTRRIAYCAQRPWLPNGTIKEAIYGDTNRYGASDQDYGKWYNEVINLCCLAHDIDSFADGDQTQIGSRGLNLSGGQRQRVVRFFELRP
jgi:ABC-type bacteriocin/lantibiotic exporter with double-glycine peptidase domain